MWAVTVLSIVGVVLNIYKHRMCFFVWAVTNFSWMVYDWHIKSYEQAALFLVYFVLAVWGLFMWRKDGV